MVKCWRGKDRKTESPEVRKKEGVLVIIFRTFGLPDFRTRNYFSSYATTLFLQKVGTYTILEAGS